jgi:hypothetical protein
MTLSSANITLPEATSVPVPIAAPVAATMPFVWPGDALPEWHSIHLLPPAQDLRLPMMEACIPASGHS